MTYVWEHKQTYDHHNKTDITRWTTLAPWLDKEMVSIWIQDLAQNETRKLFLQPRYFQID